MNAVFSFFSAFYSLCLRKILSSIIKPQRKSCPYFADDKSFLYLSYACLPWHCNGYTNRTQELLLAILNDGYNFRVLVRSGYPGDMGLFKLVQKIITGKISYHFASFPSNRWPLLFYAVFGANRILYEAVAQKAAFIHAATNHTNAMPALIAARRLGLPFQYEMRGLWELSRASVNPVYKDSWLYTFGLELEGFVAQRADRLFVISRQLGLYAQKYWGIAASKIELLPNCVDAERICPDKDVQVEAGLIGYAGAFIEYEGLDTLLRAIDMLKGQCPQAKLLLIGDGDMRSALERLVGELELGDMVSFLGKLPPDAAREQLQRCALVCIPRKPYPVCEIVPPIKLVEAMALAKPVIVPDLPVFRDEMPEEAGWFFRAGDVVDLANTIATALEAPDLMQTKGAAGRRYVVNHRQWQHYAGKIMGNNKC